MTTKCTKYPRGGAFKVFRVATDWGLTAIGHPLFATVEADLIPVACAVNGRQEWSAEQMCQCGNWQPEKLSYLDQQDK